MQLWHPDSRVKLSLVQDRHWVPEFSQVRQGAIQGEQVFAAVLKYPSKQISQVDSSEQSLQP